MSSAAQPRAFDPVSGPFRLAEVAAGRLAAEGSLTFPGARAAWRLGLDALAAAAAGRLEIDCRGISASDSAGLAVLLDWLAVAKLHGRALRFINLPPGLAALGRISEVSELLERGV
jgi:phospholipid transport system transporter-binding protein